MKTHWMGVSFEESDPLLARLRKGGDMDAVKEWEKKLKNQYEKSI